MRKGFMNAHRSSLSKKHAFHCIVFVCVFLALALFPALLASADGGELLSVDDDAGDGGDGSQEHPFNRIQDAVDEAEAEATIYVHSGSYPEEIVITKPLTLVGESKRRTIIHGDESIAITVTSSNVTLRSFTVKRGSTGLYLLPETENTTLHDFSFLSNDIGIHVNGSRNVTITNSTISFNHVGVLVENGASGIQIRHSTIATNEDYGINASANNGIEVEASFCFWGEKTGPYHETENTLGKGDIVTGSVVFRPWYESEEMLQTRVLNEESDEDAGVSFGLFVIVFLLVLVLALLVFVVWLPQPYVDSAWLWVVKTFELEKMSERDRFIIHFSLYFLALIVMVFIADLAAISVYEESNSLEPLQRLETKLVAEFQKEVMGIDVWYNGTVLFYDEDQEFWGHTLTEREKVGGVSFEVSATCSGFHETVFLSVLILGFYGVPMKKKLKWAGIFAVVIFIENLFRMIILFPYYLIYGKDKGELLHYNWWHHYQYVFIMALFMLWFYFVAWKDIDEQLDKLEGKDEKNEGGDGGSVGPKETEGTEDSKNEPASSVETVEGVVVDDYLSITKEQTPLESPDSKRKS